MDQRQPTAARTPLGQIKPAAVRDIVQRVLGVHADQRRVAAAKFSSFI